MKWKNTAVCLQQKNEEKIALLSQKISICFFLFCSLLLCCVCRTGMLVMLIQSILGIEDEEIIEDYYLSNVMLNGDMNGNGGNGSAAIRDVGLMDEQPKQQQSSSSSSSNTIKPPHRLGSFGTSTGRQGDNGTSRFVSQQSSINRRKNSMFSGTNRQDMITTLKFLRHKTLCWSKD